MGKNTKPKPQPLGQRPRTRMQLVLVIVLAIWTIVASIGSMVSLFLVPREWVLAIAAGVLGPLFLCFFASVLLVALEAPPQPLIDRNSLLWNWGTGLGRHASAGGLLVVGALVGAVVTAPDTFPALVSAIEVLLTILTVWIVVSILYWGLIATIDMFRLQKRRTIYARRALKKLGWKKTRRGFAAQIAGELSSPLTTIVLVLSLASFVLWCWSALFNILKSTGST
jgi:hypothetical protein